MTEPNEARPRPVVLCVLDGWGHRDAPEDNAIHAAETPVWDALMRENPHSLIQASSADVGLPLGQMGNSEVGHMNLGAGRVVTQDMPRIDAAIADGTLATNPALEGFMSALKASGGACHLLGLISPGGVHSHLSEIAALAKIVGGHGEGLLARADFVLSLGAMTWPHMMVRGLLAEQIYRAQQIIAGHPYHRG